MTDVSTPPMSPRRPISPTLSDATTRASQFDVEGTIITRADLRNSIQAYSQMLSASVAYQSALLVLSQAAASFADAIEQCAGLKGCDFTTASKQAAASGFHHMFANHMHLLSNTLERTFERPLQAKLSEYEAIVADRSVSYERSLKEKSKIIRQTEEHNMRMSRRKERNMSSFRASLSILQRQVEDIDRLKVQHYREVEEHELQFAELVQSKVALVVRMTFEVFDRITSKSTDSILEPMLQSIPDPFDSYGDYQSDGQIFSVLQPLALMTDTSISMPHNLDQASDQDTASQRSQNVSPNELHTSKAGTIKALPRTPPIPNFSTDNNSSNSITTEELNDPTIQARGMPQVPSDRIMEDTGSPSGTLRGRLKTET